MSSTADNSKLDAIIAAYVEATERGEKPDREQLMATHPEHAVDLAKFFADYDRMQATHLQQGAALHATAIPQHEPKPDSFIGGRYKLLQNIGEGGMGSVWVAEQKEPVKRKVAIKLVKAGMDSKQVLARFEAERQALAVMDHPNIAKVFDGGMTEHGRPYFVMEYVKGVPFTEYCDKARLSLKERLNLFIPVCQAVQHAHHKGIVHRDLKPSNILICLYDGKPVPKVIDFGLAKAMNQSLTEHSIFTGHGVMVGTPLYMSPEQAEHNNLDVDTRTDIYSLGVVLYELLTGTTPLEREQLRTAAYNEVLRLIKEVEPPRPSTRLSGSNSLPSIAAQRSIDPKHLQKSLSGDLDWIVMKSLEKERSRRYETANGLARDVERFLADEAVEACPPSLLYRFSKFRRKHRGKLGAAALILFSPIVGFIIASHGWMEAIRAKAKTEVALAEAELARTETDAARVKGEVALAEKTSALAAEATQRALADKQRELAERQLIEGLLRPIGYGDEPNTAELRSFVDWSQIPDARLKLRVLEVAFENPEVALRVARRAERAMQACVALSPTRRAHVLGLLSAKQRDQNADPRIRAAAVWLALEIGSTDIVALSEAITWISYPNPGTSGPRAEFTKFVDCMIGRAETFRTASHPNPSASAPAPEIPVHCWEVLLDILMKTTGRSNTARNGLVALAPMLNSEHTKRGWDAFIGVLEKENDYDLCRAAGPILVALVPKLNHDQIQQGWDSLIDVLEKSDSSAALETAELVLKSIAAQFTVDERSRCWDSLIGKLKEESNNSAMYAVGVGLSVLAPNITLEDATRHREALIEILETCDNRNILAPCTRGYVTGIPNLNPEQVQRGGNAVLAMLEKSRQGDSLGESWDALSALVPHLNPDQLRRAGDIIVVWLEKPSGEKDLEFVSGVLVVLAPKLTPEQTTRAFDALISVDTDVWYEQVYLNKCIEALAPQLSAEQIAQAWEKILGLLEVDESLSVQRSRGAVLAGFASRLTAEQNTQAWQRLIGVLETARTWATAEAVGDVLLALAPKLSTPDRELAWDELIHIIETTRLWGVAKAAGNSLVALAPTMNSEQTARARIAMFGVLEESTDAVAISDAGNVLVAIASKLSPDARVRTAELLVASLHRVDCGESEITEQILALMPQLERSAQDRTSNEVMSIMINYLALSEGYFLDDMGFDNLKVFVPAVMGMVNERSLATLLQHPACFGEPGEWMLQRFEELLFHEGRRVFLNQSTEEGERQGVSPPSAIPDEATLPRRFHTIHDAAAWIQQNWPDFDLEATHPVTWRGER